MFVHVLCAVGCFIHIFILSVSYFKFETVDQYGHYISYEQRVPSVTLCSMLEAKTISALNNNVDNVSLVEPTEVMSECRVRNFESNRMVAVDCASAFNVTQTVMKSLYSCHTIHPTSGAKFKTLEVVSAIDHRDLLYSLSLIRKIEKHSRILVMAHFKKMPTEEFRFTSFTQLSPGPKYLRIRVEHKLYELFKLPFPYETNCIDSSICYNDDGLRHAWCNNPLCEDTVALTTLMRTKTKVRGVSLGVVLSQSVMTRSRHVPLKTPSYFILELCSFLGIWLSISVLLVTNTSMVLLAKHKSMRDASSERRIHWHTRMIDLKSRFQNNKSSRARAPFRNKSSVRRTQILMTFKSLMKVLVLVFFIREVTFLSIDFFKYATRMKVRLKAYDIDSYPSISHCIRLEEWFDKSIPLFGYKEYDRAMTKLSKTTSHTLQELFELTPDAESAIKRCAVRHSPSSLISGSENCRQYFRVRKFYSNQFMCYYFKPLVRFIPLLEIGINSSILYSIVLRNDLASAQFYQSIVSYGMPQISRLLAKDAEKQSDHELVNLDSKLFQFKLLPPPYDTRCVVGKQLSDCESSCLNYSRINRASFSHVYDQPMNVTMLSYVDLRRPEVAKFVEAEEERCRYACPLITWCKSSFAATYPQASTGNESLQLTLMSPRYPNSFFNAEPIYTLYEYIFQVACSASFWIGFSLINLVHLAKRTSIKYFKPPATMHPETTFIRTRRQLDRSTVVRWRSVKSHLSIRKRPTCQVLKIIRCVLPILLTIGFAIHSLFTCAVYFRYPTGMDTRIKFEGNFTDLRVSVCISIDQLRLRGNYSLANIWRESPHEDDLMIGCGYRGASLPGLSHLPRNLQRRLMPVIDSTPLCYSVLKVRKFISLGLVCYETKPNTGTHDTEYRGQYQIGEAKIFTFLFVAFKVSKFDFSVSVSQGPPIIDLMSAARIHGAESWYEYYDVDYAKYIMNFLPFPYDIDVYDSQMRMLCMRKCTAHEMMKSDILPYYGESFSSHRLSYETEANRSLSKLVREQCEAKCRYNCRPESVTIPYLKTRAHGPLNSSDFIQQRHSVGLWFMTTNDVVNFTKFIVQLRLTDLIIYIGSLFSIWFGLSALQFVDCSFRLMRCSVGSDRENPKFCENST